MSFPSLQQYQRALQHPHTAFTDPVLAAGTVKSTSYGPSVISGAFALTYRVTSGRPAREYAVRCFYSGPTDSHSRQSKLATHIRSLNSPYFVDFEYIEKGIRVDGVSYPIVRMQWASGITLGEFLEANYQHKKNLGNLADSLRRLATFLEERFMAHGDIQPGNLMVSDDGRRVQLIDYDGMFTPAIAELGSTEQGHRNFQHPARSRQFGPTLDRFSFILLDVALRALQLDASLWSDLGCDPDLLLVGGNDFRAPSTSNGFRRLASTPGMAADVRRLAAICISPFESVPSLAQFLSGKVLDDRNLELGGSTGNRRAAYAGRFKVLDARDFGAFDAHANKMAELVGRIEQVDPQKTANGSGKPYYFINFSDWRTGGCVRLIVWSDVLDKMRNKPSQRWVGRYVSVKGIVNPKYTRKTAQGRSPGHPSISVFINLPNQVVFIDEVEALYRLGILPHEPELERRATNDDILDAFRAPNPIGESAPRVSPSHTVGSKPQSPLPTVDNAEVLARIKKLRSLSAPVVTNPQQTTPASRTTSSANRPNPGTSSTSSAPKAEGTTQQTRSSAPRFTQMPKQQPSNTNSGNSRSGSRQGRILAYLQTRLGIMTVIGTVLACWVLLKLI